MRPATNSIATLNDSTRYQALPGNADPEALPRLSQARQSLGTLIPRLRAWKLLKLI